MSADIDIDIVTVQKLHSVLATVSKFNDNF